MMTCNTLACRDDETEDRVRKEQNQANQQWDLEEVNTRLQKRIYKVMDDVFSRWQGFIVGEVQPSASQPGQTSSTKPSFRCIALSIAIERVARATLMRGIWP